MNSTVSPEEAADATKRLLGFYPTIQASDARSFAAGIVQLLTGYSHSVVAKLVDPAKGYPSREEFVSLPKLREECERLAQFEADLARIAATPRARPAAPRLPPGPQPDGCFANVFVSSTNAAYPKMLEWSQSADRRDWKTGRGVNGDDGIWVPHSMIDGIRSGSFAKPAAHVSHETR